MRDGRRCRAAAAVAPAACSKRALLLWCCAARPHCRTWYVRAAACATAHQTRAVLYSYSRALSWSRKQPRPAAPTSRIRPPEFLCLAPVIVPCETARQGLASSRKTTLCVTVFGFLPPSRLPRSPPLPSGEWTCRPARPLPLRALDRLFALRRFVCGVPVLKKIAL